MSSKRVCGRRSSGGRLDAKLGSGASPGEGGQAPLLGFVGLVVLPGAVVRDQQVALLSATKGRAGRPLRLRIGNSVTADNHDLEALRQELPRHALLATLEPPEILF